MKTKTRSLRGTYGKLHMAVRSITLLGACFSLLILFLSPINPLRVHAQNTAKTTVNLVVYPPTKLQNPPLTLAPIPNTSGLRFTLGPLKLIDSTIVSNAITRLYIRPEGRSDYIILEGRTNNEGILVFDSHIPLDQQGLTIYGGDSAILSLINSSTSVIDAYGFGYLGNEEAKSNNVTYAAPPKPVVTPPVTKPPRTGGLEIGSAFIAAWLLIWLAVDGKTRKKIIKRVNIGGKK